MIGKYKVITLCGSTRFKDQFLETQKRLTLEGNIVISVGLFGHSGDNEVWNGSNKAMLDDMHERKIDMADAIFVINVGGNTVIVTIAGLSGDLLSPCVGINGLMPKRVPRWTRESREHKKSRLPYSPWYLTYHS